MKRLIILSFILALSSEVYSQTGVAINNNNNDPDITSILDLTSTTKGILIPRMTQADKISIGLPGSPATGLMIYQTDVDPGFYFYSGTAWEPLGMVKAIDDLLDGSDGLGTNNMFLGSMAGEVNISGGNYNVGLGISSLQSLTSGDYNIAVGHSALNTNSTGSRNNAFGYQSMYNATTGNDYNTAMGFYSMRGTAAYTNSDYNLALGYYALYSINGGDYNVASGRSSLYNNTTGNYNHAMGFYSMYNAGTLNDYNVAIGRYAMRGTAVYTTSDYNVAIGDYSMYSINGGDNNAGLGTRSLYATTSGIGNIGMGSYAGDNITTGSYNIMLGYDIDAPTATASNQLNIGNLIYGTDLDGRDATLSTGNIGIGTKSPIAKLDVYGDLILLYGAIVDEFSTDGTLAGNSDDAVPTEKAVKTYVDANNVSFLATKTSGTDAQTSGWMTGPVDFNSERHDDGNNFLNDQFTAPSAGVYHFSATVTIHGLSDGERYLVGIYVNGINTVVLSTGYTNTSNSWQCYGGSATIKLNALDMVEIRAFGASAFDIQGSSNTYTRFSGHKLY